jgi:hypothetical protein
MRTRAAPAPGHETGRNAGLRPVSFCACARSSARGGVWIPRQNREVDRGRVLRRATGAGMSRHYNKLGWTSDSSPRSLFRLPVLPRATEPLPPVISPPGPIVHGRGHGDSGFFSRRNPLSFRKPYCKKAVQWMRVHRARVAKVRPYFRCGIGAAK